MVILCVLNIPVSRPANNPEDSPDSSSDEEDSAQDQTSYENMVSLGISSDFLGQYALKISP